MPRISKTDKELKDVERPKKKKRNVREDNPTLVFKNFFSPPKKSFLRGNSYFWGSGRRRWRFEGGEEENKRIYSEFWGVFFAAFDVDSSLSADQGGFLSRCYFLLKSPFFAVTPGGVLQPSVSAWCHRQKKFRFF